MRQLFLATAICISAFAARSASAETVLVAAAANFASAAEAISAAFTDQTGHEVLVTTGATGKLYAQIIEGAPFDVLLSADAKTPDRLEAEGYAVEGAGFAYAIGSLTIWSSDPSRIGADPLVALGDPSLRFVAIANPDLAPYGAAAREVLQGWGVWQNLQGRIVQGQNIGQVFSLVQSGAAEIGFVARSALDAPGTQVGGSRWDVPEGLFTPLVQKAALLQIGADKAAAKAFLAFLAGEDAQAIIQRYGYRVPQ